MLPDAPTHTSIGDTDQLVVTTVMGVFFTVALIFALVHWRRTGRVTVLMLFASGGLMMLFEPMVDTVGAVWFPHGNSWTAFTAYGRPIPVWLCLTYFAYFGILVSGVYLVLERGVTRRLLWQLFAGCVAADLVLEWTLLHFDTYIYYGHAPLRVLRFPLWWPPVNALIVMVAAALVHRFDGALRGRRQLLIVPTALTASAATNAAAGWPSWLAINTDLGRVGTQLGGLATVALALWFMSLIGAALTGPLRRPPAGDAPHPLAGGLADAAPSSAHRVTA